MGRRAAVIGIVSLAVITYCAVAQAQVLQVPVSPAERFRDAGQSGTAYASLILSILLVLLGPTIVIWIVSRAMRLEEVGALRCLYAAIAGLIVAVVLFYGVKPVTDAMANWTLFYKNTDLALRAGGVIVVSFIVLLFLMRVSVVRTIVFTVFYSVSLYVACRLAYHGLLEPTGAIEFLKIGK